MQVAERAARLDAELVDERGPRRAEGLERLRLPAAAVQGEHQLAAQALSQRVLARQRLQLADELVVAADREIGVDPVLERGQPQLAEPRDLALDERLVGQVGQRRPAPQRERRAQLLRRRRGIRAVGLGDEPLKAREVEL